MSQHLAASQLMADQCLCFRARRVSRALTRRYDEALRPLGIQATQLTLLNAIALSGRAFRYQESPRDGYFSPSRFLLGEISTRIGRGRELGWAFEIEGGLGLQQVQFDDPGVTRGAQRIGGSLAYRPRPGGEIVLDYGFSNVAANATGGVTGGGSVYHAHMLTLRTRLTW